MSEQHTVEPVTPVLPAETTEAAAQAPVEETAVAQTIAQQPPPPHKPASFLVRYATYCIVMPLIALSTTFFGTISLITGLWDHSGRQQHVIARIWAKTLLVFALSPVEVLNQQYLHGQGTAVYAANHLSYYDTPVLFAKLPFQFRILAKSGLWKVPFIGWYLQRSGQVAVDQSSARASIASLGRGAAALKADVPLLVFPEGGRSDNGLTRTFLAGAAYMAIKAQVPIIPLALVGTYELLPIHTYHLRPRPLKLIACAPISTVGMTTRDADKLTEQVQQIITETVFQHTADVD